MNFFRTAGKAWGTMRNRYMEGATAVGGAANLATLQGAGLGALYGGTIGRDEGQGFFGGAATGAMGGAALARYGRSAFRGARSTYGGLPANAGAMTSAWSTLKGGFGGISARGVKDYNHLLTLSKRAHGQIGARLRSNGTV